MEKNDLCFRGSTVSLINMYIVPWDVVGVHHPHLLHQETQPTNHRRGLLNTQVIDSTAAHNVDDTTHTA